MTGARTSETQKKVAVVVVHGMGEQQPMETLWGVVRALWTTDRDVISTQDREVFSKPERLTGSFELRRLTTKHGVSGKRVDFFEFYWAHLMAGSRLRHVLPWVSAVFVRSRGEVPTYLFPYWRAGWIVFCAVVIAAAILAAYLLTVDTQASAWLIPGLSIAAIFGLQAWLAQKTWLVRVLGDAARYLSPSPENVSARQEIRAAAIALLKSIHRTGEYERIVVVGHSLGSVIAYDALNYAWGQIDKRDFERAHAPGSATSRLLAELESAAHKLTTARTPETQTAYRACQRAYAASLAKAPAASDPLWLVTDFVTLGSPLSKSDVLITRVRPEFQTRLDRRELATNPPLPDSADTTQFSFQPPGQTSRVPHHAAVFGPTVWTNIYFRDQWYVFGDLIGGRVGRHFGAGVLDIELEPGNSFRHCDYWKDPESDASQAWILPLRRAINLRERKEGDVWTGLKLKRLTPGQA